MTIPLAIAGAVTGLIGTAIADFMQSGGSDPALVEQVKEAQSTLIDELIKGGMPRAQAYDEAQRQTADAMQEAIAEAPDEVTAGHYIASAVMGATLGFIQLGMIGKGASAVGGLVSKIPGASRAAAVAAKLPGAGRINSFIAGAPVTTKVGPMGEATAATSAVPALTRGASPKPATVPPPTGPKPLAPELPHSDTPTDIASEVDDLLSSMMPKLQAGPAAGNVSSFLTGPTEAARVRGVMGVARSVGRI